MKSSTETFSPSGAIFPDSLGTAARALLSRQKAVVAAGGRAISQHLPSARAVTIGFALVAGTVVGGFAGYEVYTTGFEISLSGGQLSMLRKAISPDRTTSPYVCVKPGSSKTPQNI
jgi:hypothetical protein